jgi:hypothetical protein
MAGRIAKGGANRDAEKGGRDWMVLELSPRESVVSPSSVRHLG